MKYLILAMSLILGFGTSATANNSLFGDQKINYSCSSLPLKSDRSEDFNITLLRDEVSGLGPILGYNFGQILYQQSVDQLASAGLRSYFAKRKLVVYKDLFEDNILVFQNWGQNAQYIHLTYISKNDPVYPPRVQTFDCIFVPN